MLDFIKIAAAWTVAGMLVGFGGSMILLCLRVALPLTGFIEKNYGGIDARAVRGRVTVTILIWIVLLGGVAAGLFIWGDKMVLIGAGIGAAIQLFVAFSKSGPTPQNISDYYRAYGQYIQPETLEAMLADSEEAADHGQNT